MIKFIKQYFYHSDDRGSIKGVVNFGQWEEFNIIESESKTIRGNHYHKNTEELFIILDGRMKITLQNVLNGKLDGEIEEYEVKEGDVFLINKNTNHIFEILEYSRWINILSIKIDKCNPDIVRIDS